MPVHRLRRTLGLLTASAVLATMTTATVAAPAVAAKPKCQGFKATIVGTKKNDVIRGTARRDIIVAKGGADRIYGKGGNDVICAGGGNDVVFGGPGADTLWGQLGNDILNGNAGNDFLAGQVGNDTLNGGINSDTCYQGTGSGPVLNCERPTPPAAPAPAPPPAPTADLAVEVEGPEYSLGGYESHIVTVTNNGPTPSAYKLTHSMIASVVNCAVTRDPSGEKSVLRSGESALWEYTIICGNSATVTLAAQAEPIGGPVDPVPDNNTDSHATEWIIIT